MSKRKKNKRKQRNVWWKNRHTTENLPLPKVSYHRRFDRQRCGRENG